LQLIRNTLARPDAVTTAPTWPREETVSLTAGVIVEAHDIASCVDAACLYVVRARNIEDGESSILVAKEPMEPAGAVLEMPDNLALRIHVIRRRQRAVRRIKGQEAVVVDQVGVRPVSFS